MDDKMTQFTMEQLKQKNAYVKMDTGIGFPVYFTRTQAGTWKHSKFGYEMSCGDLLDSMNSGLYSAELLIAKDFDNDYAAF
jgi:hypothetical protein